MSPISTFVLLLLAASPTVLGQAFADLTACGQTCINNVVQNGTVYGCPDDSNSCLCTKPDFSFAIHDCALQACGAAVATAVSDYATAMCATATLAAATAAATAATSSSPPAPPPTTTSAPPPPPPPPPATTSTTTTPDAAAATSSSAITTVSTTISTTTPLPTSSVTLPGSILPVTTTGTTSFKSLAVESSPSTTSRPPSTLSTSVSPSTTSPAAATTSSAAADTSETPASGLSLGAKAGIGIGAAAGVVAIIGLLLLASARCRRRRYPKDQLTSLKISEPMPGSGPSFANDPAYSNYRTGGMSELELKSRRYEDMLPRHKPRYLV